jgi:hypothetical protein
VNKKQRIRYDIWECMSREAAGAGRNALILKVNNKYALSTASGGSLRAKLIFSGPPTKKFW